jgi:hypothetical protein
MIEQTELEQGNVTYSEIVAEGERLVDALNNLAVAVKIYHGEKLEEFGFEIGANHSFIKFLIGGDIAHGTGTEVVEY